MFHVAGDCCVVVAEYDDTRQEECDPQRLWVMLPFSTRTLVFSFRTLPAICILHRALLVAKRPTSQCYIIGVCLRGGTLHIAHK